jgi:alginate O-acetyltransferase complex protein AlgI
MLFQSPLFGLFFAALVCLLLAVRARSARHTILLAGSYLFYAAWDVRFLSLLILSTAVDFVVGGRLKDLEDPRRRKLWLALSIVTNLGILGVFKYLGFFADSAADLAALFGVELPHTTLQIVLPVGISFYTFQSMSYTIDVYRRTLSPESSPLRFALYVAFFPQLVAGPIVRAAHFLPQLAADAPPRLRDVAPGIFLFAIGLFKKVVMADHFARVVDPVFDTPEFFGAGALALASLANVLQVYCDFSGYSDMAIGAARILGYRLPQNFDRPFASRSPAEMWQRWHISLSTWLRDYLYISLGGNRLGRRRTAANLMLTMTIGGLWHGAAWTYVLWGFGHGLLLVADRAWKRSRAPGLPGWLVTNGGWLVLLVCFRAHSLADCRLYLERLVGFEAGVEGLDPGLVGWVFLLFGLAALGQTRLGVELERRAAAWPATLQSFTAGFVVASAYALSAGENRAFIYFQF